MTGRRNVLYATLIICLLAGLFSGRSIFFDVALVLAIAFVTAFLWTRLVLQGLVLSRSTPTQRAQVGKTFTEYFSLRNASIFPKAWLEVWDYSTLPMHKFTHVEAFVAPQQVKHWQVTTPCFARGEFCLGPVEFITNDAFGFFQARRLLRATEQLIVYPQVIPLSQFSMPQGVLSGGDAQRSITQNVTTNATSVRDYVAGDSINRIHWRTTARRDKLTVKEFELDPMVDVWLLLDLSQASLYEAPSVERIDGYGAVKAKSDVLPASTEEYSVVIAASLANFFYESSRSFGFITHAGQRVLHLPERSHHQLVQILETLAVVRSTSETTLDELILSEMFRFSRGVTLVVVTSSDQTQWLGTLQLLQERGVKPMVVHVNAASFGKPAPKQDMLQRLAALRIPVLSISYGDDIGQVLSRRYSI